MFEKLFASLFVKNSKKSNITVMSGKREINAETPAALPTDKDEAFWNNRGKAYGALFTSLNGRVF